MTTSVGLDVGGAHLKVASVENGRTIAAEQIVCPLWKGIDQLHTALLEARQWTDKAALVGITMTGELSDLFPDRRTGVTTLIDEVAPQLAEKTVRVWMGDQGFGSCDAAKADSNSTGSTNFLATAKFAAEQVNDGILVDFGSTTTDIIAFRDGKPIVAGLTDSERLRSGELVYTGMTRTPVMGVTAQGFFQGEWQTLAREILATMADVRRILGELPQGVDRHATADGRTQSISDSTARLARMFGRDTGDGSNDDWYHAAAYIREVQVRSIQDQLMRIISGADLPLSAPIVGAGIGSDTARVLARRAGRPAQDFGTLANADEKVARAATQNAPAVAIAHLVANEGNA